jgi:hypothetical protein
MGIALPPALIGAAVDVAEIAELLNRHKAVGLFTNALRRRGLVGDEGAVACTARCEGRTAAYAYTGIVSNRLSRSIEDNLRPD